VQERRPGLTGRAIPILGLAGGYDIKWLQIEQPGASAYPDEPGHEQIEFANQIANQLRNTGRYRPTHAGTIGLEMSNGSTRFATE